MTKKINKDSVSDKQVFTTGEAAKICNVSQQTIIRCFDSGRLQGFKVPGSRFRRIPRNELVRFMQQNNMDFGRLESGPVQVLVIGLSVAETDSIIQNHAVGHNIKIHHAEDAWEAGFLAQKCKPELVLINLSVPGIQKHSIHRSLTNANGSEPMIVVVEKNYHNGINMSSQNDESTEVIKKAVLQLLSA
jgi:excisionase family DNA binding protein